MLGRVTFLARSNTHCKSKHKEKRKHCTKINNRAKCTSDKNSFAKHLKNKNRNQTKNVGGFSHWMHSSHLVIYRSAFQFRYNNQPIIMVVDRSRFFFLFSFFQQLNTVCSVFFFVFNIQQLSCSYKRSQIHRLKTNCFSTFPFYLIFSGMRFIKCRVTEKFYKKKLFFSRSMHRKIDSPISDGWNFIWYAIQSYFYRHFFFWFFFSFFSRIMHVYFTCLVFCLQEMNVAVVHFTVFFFFVCNCHCVFILRASCSRR